MRIRTIKPEFYRSQDIANLSREDRLLFVGLWSYVDDNGVGVDDYRLIVADLFPLDEDQVETRAYVREGLARLSRGSLLTRFTVDDRRYLYINSWDKHQRVDKPNRPRFPRPDDPLTSTNEPTLATPSRDNRACSKEQRNRGTEEKDKNTRPKAAEPIDLAADLFEKFWAAYPRKIKKLTAEKAWRAAIRRKIDPTHIVEAAQRYAETSRDTDRRYVPYPASWLNGGAYDDKPEPPPIAKHDRKVLQTLALKEKFRREVAEPSALPWNGAAS